MEPIERHFDNCDASFDGGDLDCGNGLLLLLRKNLDLLGAGQLLEVRSVEPSVDQDLPAWCRLTNNELISWTKTGKHRSFLIRKGLRVATLVSTVPESFAAGQADREAPHVVPAGRQGKSTGVSIDALSVMGVGSWPRPRWLMKALHEYLQGRMPESEFQETADDAVRLAVGAQIDAGVDVVTDGEQRRDNYSSFVGTRLENCQLIPLVDLLPLVDDPEDFAAKLRSLDVPADKVRHPAVFGKLQRRVPLAVHELKFAQSLTSKPVKVALPGPYLLTRTMWMECISDKAYETREQLAQDIVRVLREELSELIASGAALIQFDEPVLTEVVYGNTSGSTFMCGALSQRGDVDEELAFARDLINAVVQGFPRERLALHICRGNWTPDESAALEGDYVPLLPVLCNVAVGTLLLEFCTPRAGDISIIGRLPADVRIGLGVVNPKSSRVETLEEVVGKIRQANTYVELSRLLLNPDCGFATFADNPVATTEVAAAKMAVLSAAANALR